MPSKDSSKNHGHAVFQQSVVDEQRVQLVLLEIARAQNNANLIAQHRGNQSHRQANERIGIIRATPVEPSHTSSSTVRTSSANHTAMNATRRVTTRANNRQSVARSTRSRSRGRSTIPSTISSIQQSSSRRSGSFQQVLRPDFNLEHLHILMTSCGVRDG